MSTPLYITTMAPPAIEGTDAVMQEVQGLIDHFGGEHISIYPLRRPSRFVPHLIMGWNRRHDLQQAATRARLIHVFSATLKPVPVLGWLPRPLVYSVTASLGAHVRAGWFNRHGVRVVVNNERDRMRACAAGIRHVHLIMPGLDLSRFTCTPVSTDAPFRLMIGSAPWTRAQFATKGIDVLIETARRMPDLHLVFLWRNLWLSDLEKRIRRAGIARQVTIHNRKMDVNTVLAGCHATTVLAAHERLVKAWPHSALESLAAGKPVLLSRAIPMASFAEQHRAGVTVDSLDAADMTAAITRLKALCAQESGPALSDRTRGAFSTSTMLTALRDLYQTDTRDSTASMKE